MRDEKELLIDCLQRLNRTGLPYMLSGSMASNYWGMPRSTHDLDFVLVMQPADVPGILDAFSENFFLQPQLVQDAFQPPHQFNAIDELSSLKVDFWLLRDDPFDRNAFARRLKTTILDVPAWVASAEDIILHQLYWNKIGPSERQLSDAAGVYAVQSGSLDEGYLRQWAAVLGVQRELDDLLAGKIRPKTT